MADNRRSEPLRGAFIAIVAAAIAAGATLAGNYLASVNARDQLRTLRVATLTPQRQQPQAGTAVREQVVVRRPLTAQIEHEDSVRRDDLRRDAYNGFISAASKYEADLRRFSFITTEREASSLGQTIATDVSQIESVWSEVQLFGSAKAAGLAGTVRDAFDQITNNFNNMGWDEIALRARRADPKP
jgi:hypothetical protein